MSSAKRLFWGRVIAMSLVAVALSTCFWGQTSVPPEAGRERGSRDLRPEEVPSNYLFSQGQFIHIPGPNPAIVRGKEGTWDEAYIESCDVIKDLGRYYWYYHGAPLDGKRWPRRGYRVGLATANHPLGPWTKYEGNPILDLGPEGTWEDRHVACAFVLRQGAGRYCMWYSGLGNGANYQRWSIGLATASSPLGPWKKYPGNPILSDFGYVGSIVYHNGKYHLYTEHPISSTSNDYGPISLATADRPEGPWTIYKQNPVLKAGDWGAWDDAGFSEAKVTFWDGVFHVFYGGGREYKPRRLTKESIGYAYSFDGYHFIKYARNPVAPRDDVPGAAAFGEVHSLFEPPYVYAYHTLRYTSGVEPKLLEVEDLGIETLAISRPFRVAMPVLNIDSLPARSVSSPEASPAINVANAHSIALTVQCSYRTGASVGLRVHVRSSDDGVHYDTADLLAFDNDFRPGQQCRKTIETDTRTRFLKLLVENLDLGQDVSAIEVTATLGG